VGNLVEIREKKTDCREIGWSDMQNKHELDVHTAGGECAKTEPNQGAPKVVV
jgi:hypothetical protein